MGNNVHTYHYKSEMSVRETIKDLEDAVSKFNTIYNLKYCHVCNEYIQGKYVLLVVPIVDEYDELNNAMEIYICKRCYEKVRFD